MAPPDISKDAVVNTLATTSLFFSEWLELLWCVTINISGSKMLANIFCQLVQINILEAWEFIRLQQGKGGWGGLNLNSTSDKVTEFFCGFIQSLQENFRSS
jgi:hypothetical protein